MPQEERFPSTESPGDLVTVVLSLSRSARTARVTQGRGATVEEAVGVASRQLLALAEPEEISSGRLKLDVVLDWQREAPGFGDAGLLDRRQLGYWLAEPGLLLLSEELLSRQVMDTGGRLRPDSLRSYLAEDGRGVPPELVEIEASAPAKPEPNFPVVMSFFEDFQGGAYELVRGNRQPEITPDALLSAAIAGGEYLLRHQLPDGSFGYNYDPRFDGYLGASNLLRQAGTCYSLFELFEKTGDERFLVAGEGGLESLLRFARPPRPEDTEAGFEAIVSRGGRAKLGGTALALLALLKHYEVTEDDRWREKMDRLARFLTFQQAPDGRFEHLYFLGKAEGPPFESLYYPGEAVLALVRYSRIHPEGSQSSWFNAAERGAGWLMGVRDLGKTYDQLPHDHWLLMALDELHELTGGRRQYYLHGRRIALGILSTQRQEDPNPEWVGTYYAPPGSTSTATRSEALIAIHSITLRAEVDPGQYQIALEKAAAFQLRCQFNEENVLYLPRPDRSLGGFREGLAQWSVRIDYVQHNLSSLLGLREILLTHDLTP
ncbi:MAG: hypothetical protein K0U98_19985 [Deltaproteobacteria bacterium]|nr:hypothetical protein [Deltaproteobacteria bacterium]